MSPTQRNLSILAAGALLAATLAGGFFWGRSRVGSPAVQVGATEPGELTASVKVVPMQKGTLSSGVTAFGSIVPEPGASRTLSVAYESRVRSIIVREGEIVAAGTPLLILSGSPDAELALDQARIDAKAAEVLLEQTRNRHDLKLADNGQLAQAQQAFDSAQAKVSSLETRNMSANHTLKADTPGVVVKISVQSGAVVAPGGSLLDLADISKLEARLGVEPQKAEGLRPGSTLMLEAVDGSIRTIQARLRTVSPALNPATRLRDVYASLPPGHPFVLGQYVQGTLSTRDIGGPGGNGGVIVPYSAVLPAEGHYLLYTVRKDRAIRHQVQVLRQDGDRVQVAGAGLDPTEPVVVQGNYELQDGMAVRIEKAP